MSSVSQCTLPCPLGYTPNMDCTGCDPVHICVTNDPCQNRATCNISTNSNTDYTCLCPANYTGQNCESEYKCYLKQLYSFFFQYALHLVHLDMSPSQLALVNVFQCISVSPTTLCQTESTEHSRHSTLCTVSPSPGVWASTWVFYTSEHLPGNFHMDLVKWISWCS